MRAFIYFFGHVSYFTLYPWNTLNSPTYRTLNMSFISCTNQSCRDGTRQMEALRGPRRVTERNDPEQRHSLIVSLTFKPQSCRPHTFHPNFIHLIKVFKAAVYFIWVQWLILIFYWILKTIIKKREHVSHSNLSNEISNINIKNYFLIPKFQPVLYYFKKEVF